MARDAGQSGHRLARLAIVAAGVAVALAAAAVVPSWYAWLVPGSLKRAMTLGFLRAVGMVRIATLVVAPVALVALGVGLARDRRRGRRRPRMAKALALAASALVGLGLAELAAAAWLAWPRTEPAFPERFPAGDGPSRREIVLVVLGESSARGEPYGRWMSMPAVVARGLGGVFPGRPVTVRMAAYSGSNLEMMHHALASQSQRPHAILVYAGHNEFTARMPWDRSVPHYRDEIADGLAARVGRAVRGAPLGRLLAEAADAHSLDRPPPPKVTRDLIDVPAYTPAEYRATREEFRDRLAAIAAYGRRVGALTILIVPPSNEAGFEPTRSFLDPSTTRADREAFRRWFVAARADEAGNPGGVAVRYRAFSTSSRGSPRPTSASAGCSRDRATSRPRRGISRWRVISTACPRGARPTSRTPSAKSAPVTTAWSSTARPSSGG